MSLSRVLCLAAILLCVAVVSEAGTRGYSPCGHCHANAKCVRYLLSYKCACNYGYYGNGKTCTKTDACHTRPYPCSRHATCTVQHYRPVCTCKPGWKGNGKYCQKDVCYNHYCPEYSICKPALFGRYRCVCQPGYYRKGKHCVSNYSCRYRCGAYKHGLSCQCNKNCKHYGNCCSDFKDYCYRRHG